MRRCKPSRNNRRCINPDHLEIGSRGENLLDNRDFSANGEGLQPALTPPVSLVRANGKTRCPWNLSGWFRPSIPEQACSLRLWVLPFSESGATGSFEVSRNAWLQSEVYIAL
jgi:hypothetical protein